MTTPRYWDPTTSTWVAFPIGSQGPQGASGSNGTNGAQGPQGGSGAQGAQGAQGSAGNLTGPAGGDLSGNYPNPHVAGLLGFPISSGFGLGSLMQWNNSNSWIPTTGSPVVGNALLWNGTTWAPGTPPAGALTNYFSTTLESTVSGGGTNTEILRVSTSVIGIFLVTVQLCYSTASSGTNIDLWVNHTGAVVGGTSVQTPASGLKQNLFFQTIVTTTQASDFIAANLYSATSGVTGNITLFPNSTTYGYGGACSLSAVKIG